MKHCFTMIALASLLSLAPGCASTTQVKAGAHDQFRNALVESCRAVNMGELHAAELHLSEARALATSPQHAAKVADMELVLSGAQAMNNGHPREAARAWLAIRDRSLKNQVISLAEDEGIDLFVLARNTQVSP